MRAPHRRTFRWLLLALLAGCAGPVVLTGNEYRHREHGYAILAPRGVAGDWKRIEVEGAGLAFRGPHAETMIVKSRCGRPVAASQLMARHLLIGLEQKSLLEARPVAIAGRSGWLQVVETRNARVPVRLKTVTLVDKRCSYDLVLAASRARFGDAVRAFDVWTEGFRLTDSGRDA